MRWMFGWKSKSTKSKETSLKLLRNENDEDVIGFAEQTLVSSLSIKEIQAIVRNIIELHGSKSVIDRRKLK